MDELKPQITSLPVSQAFIKYIDEKNKGTLKTTDDDGHPLGYIPPPFALPEDNNIEKISKEATLAITLPSSYDLRDHYRVSAVRNQGTAGTCWAFAAYGSLESNLLPEKNDIFSVNNLVQNHGFTYGPTAGGNEFMAMAYHHRWSGPVFEADDPYPYTNTSNELVGPPVRKHIQETLFPRHINLNEFKQLIMDYGGFSMNFFWNTAYYNPSNYSYYCPEAYSNNHSVVIIGWDDNFSKNNFNTPPQGDGAFIIKNSWGSSWGDNGFFYMSYYDLSLRIGAIFNSAEETNNFSNIYQYDTLGFIDSLGYKEHQTVYVANIFTVSSSDPLAAVGFYTTQDNTQYKISIYLNCNGDPVSGALVTTKTGFSAFAKYSTVMLDNPVLLENAYNFSIVIEFYNPEVTTYFSAIEQKYPGYSDNATIDPGTSFISIDGSAWSDIYDFFASYGWCENCIKGYTAPSNRSDIYTDVIGPEEEQLTDKEFTYTITIGNYGLEAAVNVSLTDILPVNTAFISASLAGYVYDSVNRTLKWTFGSIPAGEIKTIDVLVKALSAGPALSIVYAASYTSDTNYTNNHAEFSVTIIPAPTIEVVSPNGGENWLYDTTHTISWTYTGSISTVNIELLKGTTSTAIVSDYPVGTGGSGSYSWYIPNGTTPGNDYKIRISVFNYPEISDTSDNNFTISAPVLSGITVENPNGSEIWSSGHTYVIAWNYTGITGNVKIELLKGGSIASTIASSTSIGSYGHGYYYWAIPETQAPGADYRIKVTSLSDSSKSDISNNDFTITSPPASIKVTSPNGGQVWKAGTMHVIGWSYTDNPGNIKIELLDNDVVVKTISSNTPMGSHGFGYYYWMIPSAQLSDNKYKVKITSISSPSVTDTSDASFTIY